MEFEGKMQEKWKIEVEEVVQLQIVMVKEAKKNETFCRGRGRKGRGMEREDEELKMINRKGKENEQIERLRPKNKRDAFRD